MDYKEAETVVCNLNTKAERSHDATEALKFSQAALNAANAYCSLRVYQRGVS